MTRSALVGALVCALCVASQARSVPLATAVPNKDLPDQPAGFIKVNETTGGFMFYWLVPAQNGDAKAPTVLWLQGGPGASSVQDGLFLEHGPYMLEDGQLTQRKTTWAQEFNMVYVDNPVGTGFSYVEHSDGYVTNELQVAMELYAFLEGFFQKHTELQNTPFFITGESFGGHYVPAICHYLLFRQLRGDANEAIPPLLGLAVGDGLVDPQTQVTTKPLAAYHFGLVDMELLAVLEQYATETVQFIEQGDYIRALDARTKLEDSIVNASHVNIFDVREFGTYKSIQDPVKAFLNLNTTRAALHVGDHPFATDPQVAESLAEDKMKSTAGLFPDLLSNLRVLLYQGQFDLKDGVVASEAWIQNIQWSDRDNFLNATRQVWFRNDDETQPAGWVKAYGNLTEVVISSAGHMSPMNQPDNALDMIARFVRNKPFTLPA